MVGNVLDVRHFGASLQWHGHNGAVVHMPQRAASLYAIAETRCMTTRRPEEP